MNARAGSGKKNSKRTRILLGEAEPGEARLSVRDIVAADSEFGVTSASTLAETLALLKESRPDILLLDLALPGGTGLEGLRQVRQVCPQLPTIVLAGRTEGELTQRALQEGAVDLLMKGHIDLRAVLRAVHHALWKQQEKSSSLHPHGLDRLTGLFNRHGFERIAARYFEQAQKQDGTLVLLRTDIDNLAAISRVYGPAEAHRALLATAQLLLKSFRRTDLVGRIGEHRFAALLIDAAEPSAPVLRQRLERRLEALNGTTCQPYRVSLNIGVRFWKPAQGRTLKELIRAAEAELQHATREKKRAQQLRPDAALQPAAATDSEPGES